MVWVAGEGRHKAYPYGGVLGKTNTIWEASVGRHKAYPYGGVLGKTNTIWEAGVGRHKAYPYGGELVDGGGVAGWGARAGTRRALRGI
ncbi:MAG: hypothetical protein OXJ55_13120 [Caldilineaceae bacterium]|nr:hypothetical protein [Caldilineaceae bacterium]MDE0465094.1 hypothetical protein [Caldilineaceae bacterium]